MFVYRQELPVIARNSLINCHVRGLDSVVFDNTPGRRVRAYVTREDHELHTNRNETVLSLAIHPHHCDLEIERVFGNPAQVIPFKHPGGNFYSRYIYRSEITDKGRGGFVPTEGGERFMLQQYYLRKNEPWFMAAKDLHSFYVPKDETAAWTVREFREDTDYEPVCFSDNDLINFTTDGLYLPMSIDYLREILDTLKVDIVG